MKAIVGGAGSGKTSKIVELIGEMASRQVKIIDGETTAPDYAKNAERLGVRMNRVRVHVNTFNTVVEVLGEVLKDTDASVLFVDVPMNYSIKDLEVLESIEAYLEKDIYICIQTNRKAGFPKAEVKDWRELIGGVYK